MTTIIRAVKPKDARRVVEETTQHIIEQIAKAVVSHPEDITVRFIRGEQTTVFHIDCTQRVIGQIMGAKGKTINSIRSIVNSTCCMNGFRGIVEIPYFPIDP